MSKKLKITVAIEDENGETVVSRTSEREVPYIEEIESQGFRSAFHDYETAVLESRKEVNDAVTSEYFELVSKKKTKTESALGDIVEMKAYRIESELGEITTYTHKLTGAKGQPDYDSGESFFEKTASREKFKSNRMMELILDYSTDMSDRAAARRLNRIRHETKGIIATTYRNTVEREGRKIAEHIEKKCEEALESNGFSVDGELKENTEFMPEASKYLPIETLGAAMAELKQKKCNQQLSLALNSSKVRKEFLKELLPCLWFGNVDGAIKLFGTIHPKRIKNAEEIDKLIGYFERCRAYIPNYALRKELGLRNSSNLGEKSNDLIVSSRQKHNGMSWSDDGSRAFASVAAAYCNDQILNWVHSQRINFDFVPFQEAV